MPGAHPLPKASSHSIDDAVDELAARRCVGTRSLVPAEFETEKNLACRGCRYDQVRMSASNQTFLSPPAVGEEVQSPVDVVLSWVHEQQAPPVSEDWVPGASEIERQALAALGGAVGSYWKLTNSAPAWVQELKDVAEWTTRGPEAPRTVTTAVGEIARCGPDAIARLYNFAVHPTARRQLGTFFTPSAEARWMVERWSSLFGSPDAAVDVGAGVGVFTAAAHDEWPDADLIPIDVNPVTLGLIALLSSSSLNRRMWPVQEDFAAWSRQGFVKLVGTRLVLGNPPYTRLQMIPPAQRMLLLESAGGLCTARASLSALMLGTALSLVGPRDGVCLLLPAQWLESDYARGLRGWLWDQRERRIELHLFESQLFPDAQVDAVSLLVGPVQSTQQPFVLGVAASTSGSVESRTREADRAADLPGNWRRLFDQRVTYEPQPGVPIAAFGLIRRGAATGANDYFTLSHEEVKRWNLPSAALRPYVQRTRDYDQSVTATDLQNLGSHSKQFMLVIDRRAISDRSIREYLRHGIRRKIHARVLTRSRSVWFAVGSEATPPDIILSASARTGFTVLENAAEAVIANNLYGIRWHNTTSLQTRVAIVGWLRSPEGQSALIHASRRQADGLRKIEISQLAQVSIPDRVLA